MMMAMPNTTGRPTSTVAFRMRSPGPPGSPERRMMFSTITTEPSTRRPKSRAPRLMRFAEKPNQRIMMKAHSIENGMTTATIRLAAMLRRKSPQQQDDERASEQQVLLDGVGGAADQFGLVVERHQLDARRQGAHEDRHPRLDARDDVLGVGALPHDDHAAHDLATRVVGHRALPRQRAPPYRRPGRPSRRGTPSRVATLTWPMSARPVSRPMPWTMKRSSRFSV